MFERGGGFYSVLRNMTSRRIAVPVPQMHAAQSVASHCWQPGGDRSTMPRTTSGLVPAWQRAHWPPHSWCLLCQPTTQTRSAASPTPNESKQDDPPTHTKHKHKQKQKTTGHHSSRCARARRRALGALGQARRAHATRFSDPWTAVRAAQRLRKQRGARRTSVHSP